MKIKQILILGFLISLLLSCNSSKENHSHSHNGGESHSHESISNYFGDYTIQDNTYGTKTTVTVKGNERKMVTNSLPNHETGAFPNPGNPNTISLQSKSYTFPVNPNYTGKAQWIREPGIALNGVKFEPGTAEVVQCETGENYRVEAIQNVIDLGLDFNHAHVQPTGEYHYHGSPTSLISNDDNGEDLVHVGFAHDGFPMYFSKSGKYKPSFKLLDGSREGEDCTYSTHKTIDISVGGHHDGTYGSDYEYVSGYGDLDECNGITVNGQYMYFVTESFPYVSRCLMGEVKNEQQRRPNGGRGQRPDASALIKQMDKNNDGKLSKAEAKGPINNDFSKIDSNNDGFITKTELDKGSGNNQRPPKHN